MKFPTPEDVDYFKNDEYSKLKTEISELLKSRKYEFHPRWNHLTFLNRLKADISEFGWNIRTSTYEDRQGSSTTWIFEPIKKNG